MAAIPLFRGTNMAAVTSRENTLFASFCNLNIILVPRSHCFSWSAGLSHEKKAEKERLWRQKIHTRAAVYYVLFYLEIYNIYELQKS